MTAISIPIETDFESGNSRAWELLERRMKLPQRHRLLHGYPLYTGMRAASELTPARRMFIDKSKVILPELQRGLLIGVLPHPFCNPSVRGCGYCTFPHQPYRRSEALKQVNSVIREIRQHSRVIHEPGKCIKCGLCVQITEQETEDLGLSFIGRGFDVKVGIPFNGNMEEALKKAAEKCVTACPTAALAFRDD